MPRSNVDLCSDPNDMWQEWKQMFVSCMDKHAPRKLKRISKKRGLRGLLEGYCIKCIEEIELKRKQFFRTIMTCGSNLNLLETKQIMN